MLLLGCSGAACDSGVVTLKLLSAAGSSADAGGAGHASGGSGGTAGDPHGDMGGPLRFPPPCDQEWDIDQEDALLQTLSEAFDSGRYCPRWAPPQRRTLVLDPELQWQARASICLPYMDRGWFQINMRSRGPVFGWMLIDTPNLEDAKKALLGEEHQNLCESAERNPPFRLIGVGHHSDAWAIFVSSGFPEDMQKP